MSTKMKSEKQAITLMFDRPSEPLIVPKGEKAQATFDLPDRFLNSRHRTLKNKIKKRFENKGERHLVIENISVPDITRIRTMPIMENFSLFMPNHRELAGELIDLFMGAKNVSDLISLAAYCRDRLNPYLFNYSLAVVLLHREDTKDVVLPNFFNSFPGKFLDSQVFSMARKEATVIPEDSREPIVLPKNFTSSDLEPEQRVAYFREDIGINLHHWHWHLVYPFNAKTQNIVDKDRRGELFYYMHQQILARYNTERFCNDLPTTKSLDLREPILEGYFPKLHQLNAGRAWPPRFANVLVRDINRPSDKLAVKLEDLEYWLENIKEAISDGYVVDRNAKVIRLEESNGINVLGNIIESTSLSPNRDLYGDLHNKGHVIMSLCHDPDGRYLESFGVMGDTSTAMRDPIFYRWHTFINNLLVSYKDKLPYYTREQRDFDNITMLELKVMAPNKKNNEFHTYWEQSDVNMSRGIDFAPKGPIIIRSTHLQHEPFRFSIKIKNASSKKVIGTVRIFIGSKYNESLAEPKFEEQRKMMIELDKFTVELAPGMNTFLRTSDESSVTISYDKTFRNIDISNMESPEELKKFRFCGCGWPDHMLIPKGTTSGYAIKVFAMVSNYEHDKVPRETTPQEFDADAVSYCGLFNDKYPDKRSMGFPFDRPAKKGVQSLEEFLTPNMMVVDALIVHTDKTIVRDVQIKKDYHVTTPTTSKTEKENTGPSVKTSPRVTKKKSSSEIV